MVYSELEKLINAYPETHEERGNRDLPNSYYGVRDKWNENVKILNENLIKDKRWISNFDNTFFNQIIFQCKIT